MELRRVSGGQVRANTDFTKCPVVFTGTRTECRKYAASKDYWWKVDLYYLYHGYYVDKNGNCLMPT